MRRIVLWLAATVTVLVLLFAYHTSINRTTGAASSVSTPAPTGSGTPVPSSPSNSSSGATSRPSPSTAVSPSTTSPNVTSRTYTGATAQTQWGIVQVTITVQAKKITAVGVPQYPNGNPRDAEINSYALPTLVKETLQSQSAKIDVVSGATVTSDGYLQSLQSALDQAGI